MFSAGSLFGNRGESQRGIQRGIFRKSREKTLVLENLNRQMMGLVSGADSKEMPLKNGLRSHLGWHKGSEDVAREQACWPRCPALGGLPAESSAICNI